MLRVSRRAPALVIVLILATPAAAQELHSDRAPRFLIESPTSGAPLPADVGDLPMLRKRVTMRLVHARLEDALTELSRQAGIRLVYSADVVALDTRVSLVADDISIAAALTELLFDTRTDVLVTREGHAALVRRTTWARAPLTITGRVTDGWTGIALADAIVDVDGTPAPSRTGDDGRYRITGIAPGSHTITARRIGYAQRSRSATVDETNHAAIDMALTARVDVLDRVIVAGSLVPSTMAQSPVSVTLIDAEQIDGPSRNHLDRLFRGAVPGVVGYDNGAFALGTLTFVRGNASLDDENLLKVYVDGVEAPPNALTSIIDLTSVEHAELLRGPQGSTLYGSNASGGVLLLFTKRGHRGPPRLTGSVSEGLIASDYTRGSSVTMEHRLSVSGGGGNFDYAGGGSFDATGPIVPGGDRHQMATYGHGTFVRGSLSIAVTGALGHRVVGAVTVPAFRDLDVMLPDSLRDAHLSLDDRLVGVAINYAPSSRWQHHLTVGEHGIAFPNYVARQRFIGDTRGNDERVDDHVSSARYLTSLTLSFAPGLKSTTTAGIEYARRTRAHGPNGALDPFAPSGRPTDTSSANGGVFAQQVLSADDRLFVTAGLRGEGNSDIGSERGVIWLPRIGIASPLQVGHDVTLKARAAYGRSIRAPQAGQANEGVLQRANPALRPETYRGTESGVDVDYGHGLLGAEVTYFDQRATDLIGLTSSGNPFDPAHGDTVVRPYLQYRNAGRVRNRGMEVAIHVAAGRLQIGGTYSTVQSVVEQLQDGYIGDQRAGEDMLFVARRSGGSIAAMRFRPLLARETGRDGRISMELTYVGARHSLDLLGMYRCDRQSELCPDAGRYSRLELPPFMKVRVNLTQPISRGIDGFVGVDNLTNVQRGELLAVVPSRGRTVFVGARFGR